MFKIILIWASYLTICSGYLSLEWEPNNPAFDPNFYEDLLNPELCQEQLSYILSSDPILLAQFLDAGIRLPRGITQGNFADWGNYYQCLGINEPGTGSTIEGKFCFIEIPLEQNINISLPWIDNSFHVTKLKIDNQAKKNIERYNILNNKIGLLTGSGVSKTGASINISNIAFRVAICLPKPCTTREALNSLLNISAIGFQYEDVQCRVKHDKLWTPGDYVAIVIFSSLAFLTVLSTGYDISNTHWKKSDTKFVNHNLKIFSLYSNTKRLVTFTKNPSSVECIDGIRCLSMLWVIVGHTFYTLPPTQNAFYSLDYTLSLSSLWVTSAFISVDSFFMLSGLLVVYTVAHKMTGMKLLKNLHLFYLNRLFRMFPLLAAGILLQATFFHWLSDGPHWDTVATQVEYCRNYWWATLFYVQNYVTSNDMCLSHSWYLAIDIQLHILSPLILFWVFGRKKSTAWIALNLGLFAFLISSTVFIFIMKFPGSGVNANRSEDTLNYTKYYYMNTLTRASPFFVGMIFGYLLHIYRGATMRIPKPYALLTWILTLCLTSLVIYSSHPMKDFEWDNQTVDSLVNSFHRPVWAACLGWIIFACHHGYGGPINWLLSLQFWKLPSRLSYGMYIFHFPMMQMVSGAAIAPFYFTVSRTLYRFFSNLVMAVVVSFVMTIFIDSPFTIIIKRAMSGGTKTPRTNGRDTLQTEINKPVNC